MDKRGQLSVEYLLLVLIILIILGTVTIPLIGDSIDAANDVSQVAAARSMVDDISNAVNIVYANGPGAKRTLNVYLPAPMNYSSNNNEINMKVALSDDNIKQVTQIADYKVNEVNNLQMTKGNYKAVVEWLRNSNFITITLTQL